MTTDLRSLHQWHRGVPLSAKPHAIVGLAILLLWLGCFGVWAGLAPLQGAVVASGTFVATGQNRLAQHLEGGIIRDLLVTEGDLVEANQVLVRMDDTAAKTKLRQLVLRKYRLLTMQARLQAEMQSADVFETPAAFAPHAADPEAKACASAFGRHPKSGAGATRNRDGARRCAGASARGAGCRRARRGPCPRPGRHRHKADINSGPRGCPLSGAKQTFRRRLVDIRF